MHRGFVKVYRKILESPIWKTSNANLAKVAVHCLLRANHKEAKVMRGRKVETLKPGQFLTSLDTLKFETKLSIQTIRTCLLNLEKFNFLTINSTKAGTIISIINWDSYANPETSTNKHDNNYLTNDQQTINNKQECKNDKNERIEDSVSDETEQSSQIENLDFENVFKGPPDPAKENTHSVFIGRLKDIFKGDRAVKNSKAAWQWVSKEWLRVLQKYDPDEEWRRKQLSFEHRLYQVLNEFVEDGRPFDFAAANAKLRNPRFDEQQKRSDAMKQQDQRAGSNLFNEFPEGG